MGYSKNGDSTFNPVVVSLELLRTGDVERSPGDTTTSQTKIELPNKGLRIGHCNFEHLTDSKFEQISLLLTTCKKIDILFLQETFLNATKPDSFYNIPDYVLHRRDRENKSGGGLLAHEIENLQSQELILIGDINFDYSDQSAYCKHRLSRALKSLTMSQHINVVTSPKVRHA